MGERKNTTRNSESRLVNGLIITAAILSIAMVAVLAVLIITIVQKNNAGSTPSAKTAKTYGVNTEEALEDTSEESQPPQREAGITDSSSLFTPGSVFVTRGGWTCLRMGSSMTIYQKGQEKYKISGVNDCNFFAADDGVYYTKDFDFCYFSYASGLETVIMKSRETLCPLGMAGSRFLLASSQDDTMEFHIIMYDKETESSITLDLPELWGDVEKIFCNDRLYYIGGRTDVSTRPLYEVDLEKGRAVQIDPACGTGLSSYGSKLYYCSAESAGSLTDSAMTLVELDTETDTKTEITPSSFSQLQKPVWASDGYVYVLSQDNGKELITQWNIDTGSKADVITGHSLAFINSAEDGFYYSSYASEEATLYLFKESTGDIVEIGKASGIIAGYSDGYIYYSVYNDEKQVRQYYRENASHAF